MLIIEQEKNSILQIMKILITGGGGVTGRAIARSIKLSTLYGGATLISADIFHNEYGIHEGLFDRCYKLPHVDSENYASKFQELIERETPDAVLIMTEKEAIYWGKNKPFFPALISPYDFSIVAGNKARLYSVLANENLVPHSLLYQRNEVSFEIIFKENFDARPVWVRCYEEGTSSGKGAYLVKSVEDAQAWFNINSSINSYLVSEVLPGGNYACNMLLYEGKLLQHAIYERLEYFMPHLSPSGITGNISVGRLLNDQHILENSLAAIRAVEKHTSTHAHGIYTVDLKGDTGNNPLITEINLRHTAATSSFAQGGCNMAEFQVAATVGRFEAIPSHEIKFHPDNRLLRDIDGIPVYLDHFKREQQERLIDLSK